MAKKKKEKKKRDNTPRPCFKCRLCGCRWVSDSDPHCWLCNDLLGIPQNKEAEKLIDDRSKKDGRYFKDAV